MQARAADPRGRPPGLVGLPRVEYAGHEEIDIAWMSASTD